MEPSMLPGFSLVLYVMLAGIIKFIKSDKISSAWFDESKVGQRILPILPIAISLPLSCLVWWLGWDTQISSFKAAVSTAITTGFYSMGIFKLAKTSVMGKGLEEK